VTALALAPSASLQPAGFDRWDTQVAGTGYCSHPIRLVGRITQTDRATGHSRESYTTAAEPTGQLLKACGNRRAGVCPTCAETYRRDAWHLVAAGLRGNADQAVPVTVATHPMVFATFTAPTFGPVHTSGMTTTRCHKGSPRKRCRHGRPLACWRVHDDGDPLLGAPLCPRCHDTQAAVLWNALAPKLWQRTTIYLYRAIARDLGVTQASVREVIRLSFVKVAEYQRRGLIHYHGVIRIDAATATIAPPPRVVTIPKMGRRRRRVALPAEAPDRIPAELFTTDRLSSALHALVPTDNNPAQGVTVRLQLHPEGSDHIARWGPQLDIIPINEPPIDGDPDDELTGEKVAAYIAKYATKSTETFSPTGDWLRPGELPSHIEAMVAAAWELDRNPRLRHLRLGKWVHMLGYGGHWSTKSRRYATTLGAIRRARAHHARQVHQRSAVPLDAWGRPLDEDQVAVVAVWSYDGRGFRTVAEAALATAAAARAREHYRAVREQQATTAA
jgi:replication initiator protein RepSA